MDQDSAALGIDEGYHRPSQLGRHALGNPTGAEDHAELASRGNQAELSKREDHAELVHQGTKLTLRDQGLTGLSIGSAGQDAEDGELTGLYAAVDPPRLEDAGLEDCALPTSQILEAFAKARAQLAPAEYSSGEEDVPCRPAH